MNVDKSPTAFNSDSSYRDIKIDEYMSDSVGLEFQKHQEKIKTKIKRKAKLDRQMKKNIVFSNHINADFMEKCCKEENVNSGPILFPSSRKKNKIKTIQLETARSEVEILKQHLEIKRLQVAKLEAEPLASSTYKSKTNPKSKQQNVEILKPMQLNIDELPIEKLKSEKLEANSLSNVNLSAGDSHLKICDDLPLDKDMVPRVVLTEDLFNKILSSGDISTKDILKNNSTPKEQALEGSPCSSGSTGLKSSSPVFIPKNTTYQMPSNNSAPEPNYPPAIYVPVSNIVTPIHPNTYFPYGYSPAVYIPVTNFSQYYLPQSDPDRRYIYPDGYTIYR
jgi:hypothetical protein